MSAKTQVTTKVTTGKVRLSYAHIWEPKAIEQGATPKYSVAILIPKGDTQTLDAVKEAIEAAKQAGASKWGGKIPPRLKLPLRDGDEERPGDEAYAGHYFINANSTTKPGIVDRNLHPILEKDEVYSGCYARVSINFYAFDTSGNKGIAAGLGNIQKWADGEPLAGGSTPEEDFGTPIIDEDDDLL